MGNRGHLGRAHVSSESEPPRSARGEVLAPAGTSSGDRSWGQVLGTGRAGSGRARLHLRPERVDGLQHVVGKLAGTVGGGQAFDQFHPGVAALELEEELLTVDRRPRVDRAQRLLGCGRVQDDEDARYALAEVQRARSPRRASPAPSFSNSEWRVLVSRRAYPTRSTPHGRRRSRGRRPARGGRGE
jgi:hypothetical protein